MTTLPDYDSYLARMAAFAAREAEILPLNKTALFDALQSAGIHSAIVTFDGYGDSGQIERIDAYLADSSDVNLPDTTIDFRTVSFEDLGIGVEQLRIAEVIERMSYNLLWRTHASWENNDGAYGEFSFSVAERSITLEYNERYTESHYHEHEF